MHRGPIGKLKAAAWAAHEELPSDAEMAASGLSREDFDADEVEVWPENWPSWALYAELSGQWRVGFNGRIALDYTTLFMRLDRMRLDDHEWQAFYTDIRVIEQAVLKGPPK